MKIRKQFEIKGIKFDQKPINGYFNYKQAIEYAESVGKILISKHEMELLLTLPRKRDSTTLYIAEKEAWLEDPDRRIELPRLGYRSPNPGNEYIMNVNIAGYYWILNNNPYSNLNRMQSYFYFNIEGIIKTYNASPFYEQSILLKTP